MIQQREKVHYKRRLNVSKIIPIVFLAVFCLLILGCAHALPGFDKLSAFEEIPVGYRHVWTEETHPFSGAAVIDVDGDGRMEIFVGGGEGQNDALLRFDEGRLHDVIEGIGLSHPSATYGPVAMDMDDDGDTDLVVPRNDGLYLHLNTRGQFETRKIPVALPKNAVPLSVAVSDIDHDGDGDLYLSVFVAAPFFRSGIFNEPDHAKGNVLLRNDGGLNFTDITAIAGVAGKQNTFLSVFVDLNADGWQDLVLAQNTGEVEIFRNNKDQSFTAMPTHSGYGFWMGLAVGDIDRDGDQDLFFTNIGASIPAFLTKGDIRPDQRHTQDWLLLRNEGDFQFSDITRDASLDGEGFAWGAVFEDLNLDGRLDLLVAQNYIKWPIHKLFKLQGRVFLQGDKDHSGVFLHAKVLGLENRYFGQSPLIADLNDDGRPDVLWINMDGPVRAFINRSTGHFITIALADTVAALGTRIYVETAQDKSTTREVLSSTGLLTDQSPDLFFGLGDAQSVEGIVIQRPNGETKTIAAPGINKKIRIE